MRYPHILHQTPLFLFSKYLQLLIARAPDAISGEMCNRKLQNVTLSFKLAQLTRTRSRILELIFQTRMSCLRVVLTSIILHNICDVQSLPVPFSCILTLLFTVCVFMYLCNIHLGLPYFSYFFSNLVCYKLVLISRHV
jgi:hypothetical protein